MIPYIFVAAAAIAALGIISAYKKAHNAILEGQNDTAKIQSKFFLHVAIIEALPIILVIIGFMFAEGQTFTMQDIYIPLAIIIGLFIFNAFIVFSQISQVKHLRQSKQIDEPTLNAARGISFIAIAVSNAVPIISLVFTLMITS
ncbi:hypothetical protein [Oceanobacillus sp. 1P07AA]|uniref:hypothetical protein n=1 Tax=Oceanobacillus sp. 1P07AA TaxID=3132293 RepID=UPI0039A48189